MCFCLGCFKMHSDFLIFKRRPENNFHCDPGPVAISARASRALHGRTAVNPHRHRRDWHRQPDSCRLVSLVLWVAPSSPPLWCFRAITNSTMWSGSLPPKLFPQLADGGPCQRPSPGELCLLEQSRSAERGMVALEVFRTGDVKNDA